MIRVLLISSLFPNPQEPIKGIFVKEQVKEISKYFKFEVLAPIPYFPPIRAKKGWYKYSQVPLTEKNGNITVHHPRFLSFPKDILFPLSGKLYFWSLRNSADRIKKDFDIVHAHFAYPDGYAAALLNQNLGKPLVLTVHGSDVRRYPKKLGVDSKIRWVLRNVDLVISPHPETTELAKNLGAKEIVQIPNGVDTHRFKKSIDATPFKEEFGLGREKVVVFIGRFTHFKDPITLIKAAPYVLKRRRDVKFFVIGNGYLKEKLIRMSSELGISNHVVFTGERTDINVIQSASDVFVALSPIENIWSTTILEAMASGTPCIVTEAGFTKRVLTHKKEAYLIPPHNPERLASAILEIFEDHELSRTISENGLQLVRGNFDIRIVARRIMEVYTRLVN